jgi:pilus assembly protein CpaE
MKIVVCADPSWQRPPQFIEGKLNQVVYLQEPLNQLLESVKRHAPELLLFVGYKENKEYLEHLEHLCLALPETSVVPITANLDSQYLMLLMQVGVREVLASDNPQELSALLNRIRQRRPMKLEQTSNGQTAFCFGFMSAKGGDGGTCIATNFAAALASQITQPVLLLDLSIPFGDAAIYAGGDLPVSDLSDFLSEIDRLDHDLFQHMVTKVKPNFHMIASPPTYEKILTIEPEQVEKLIRIILHEYQYVVIDIGTSIDNVSLRVLDLLHSMVVVATLTMPSLRRTSQIIGLWRSLSLDVAKLEVVINRYDADNKEIDLSHFESALEKNIMRSLPTDAKNVQKSLVQGSLLLDFDPKSRLVKSLQQWATDITGQRKTRKSFWNLFGTK